MAALAFLALRPAQADEAESILLADPVLSVSADGGWVAHTTVRVDLSPVLEEALMRGVPLYFVSEFEVRKSRWWWFDKTVFSHSKTVRLSYHAVTQQYRVAVGSLHQMTYGRLADALAAAVGMRGWRVKDAHERIEEEAVGLDWSASNLEARLRVRLDSAQLPKPLQVNAITNRDWSLSSGWVSMKVVLSNNEAFAR